MFDFIKEAGIERDTSRLYILRDGSPERCDSATDWARFMDRCQPIAVDEIGSFEVATCFTGEDLRDDGDDGAPVLWQTSTEPPIDGARRVYRSREDAIKGHAEAVKAAADALKIKPVSRQMCAPERIRRKGYEK